MAERTTTENKTARLGLQARGQAVEKLIEAHRTEYDNILGDLRVSMGLSRVPGGNSKSPQKLQERKFKLEAQLRQIREQLGETETT